MSDTQKSWEIEVSPFFDKALKECLKINYRKDKKGKKKFLEVLDAIISALKEDVALGKPEPFPKGMDIPYGAELRKFYFRSPNLKGSSAEARLIYLVLRLERKVILVHIYTHKQYEDRPALDLIRDLLK